jgi:predicted regulator of Ras-like GTPase activity (Roadblock/LC7/MglB family)
MFKSVLRDVVENAEGGIASVLMGFDGITVDSYVKDDAALDVEGMGMEFSVVLASVKQAAEMLDIGTAREIAIQAENMTTVIRLLSNEYFVAVALKPKGNQGKARFLLRKQAAVLLENLV